MRVRGEGNLSLLLGRRLDDVIRHAHFLVFRFEDLDLAVNPMLAGRFRLAAPDDKDERDLVFALDFEGRASCRYRDEKTWARPACSPGADWKAAAGMDQAGGIDVLGPEFTRERFVSLSRSAGPGPALPDGQTGPRQRRQRLRGRDLFEARLHPKTFCRSLRPTTMGCGCTTRSSKVIQEAVAEARAARRAHRREGPATS